MKKSILSAVILVTLACINAHSQVPDGFNFQGVARDENGYPKANSNHTVTLMIHTDSGEGPVVWEEEHMVTTDITGAFSLVIGLDPGKRAGGSEALFSGIDWGASSYFLQVALDGNDLGSNQLMSVPYAAIARQVEGDNSNQWTTVGNDLIYNIGNVSLGGGDPASRFTISDESGGGADTALFEVRNHDGDPVFAVFNEGVRVYIKDSFYKGTKGGFAVGGYNRSNKGVTKEFLRVTSDSVRIWINEPVNKGKKGGFAVGGYKRTKAEPVAFMEITADNNFIGHDAGASNTSGVYNSFLGYQAGMNNTTGSWNTFLGNNAGFMNTEGQINAFIGNYAGYSNTSGHENVFIGDSSGYYNDTGYWNVFVGERTGKNNVSGKSNVFIGDKAGEDNKTGSYNVFLGSIAGWENVNGNANVFIGSGAGGGNISGSENTILGSYAGRNNETGDVNIFIGRSAGYNNRTGSDNIYIGNRAGAMNDTSYANIFIGNNSGEFNTSGLGNVFLGNRSGNGNMDGSNNTIVGHEAGHFRKTGGGNTILGAYAGFENFSGEYNVMVGINAGRDASEGSGNTLIGTGAGHSSTGSQNVMLGHAAGGVSTGNNNIFLGNSAGYHEEGSDKLYIHNSSADSTGALVYGDFATGNLTFNGRVGINTNTPWNDLQVSARDRTWAKIMIGERDSIVGYSEYAGSGSGPAGGSIRLGTSADFDDVAEYWQVSVWEQNFRVGIPGNYNLFEITQEGSIFQRGNTLHADYVFDEDYTLESIEEHADFMWARQHLPSVPAAVQDESGMDVVDLGKRNRGVLEELEKAHIYIAQLNEAIKAQEQVIMELKQEVELLKSPKKEP